MLPSATLDSAELAPIPPAPPVANGLLVRELLWLALPVLAENILHMAVGFTDTYLGSHLPLYAAAATAAVGSITYVLWLLGLLAGAIGTGSTAIIARAFGAKHQRLANSVCGQSITVAVVSGTGIALLMVMFAVPLSKLTGLTGPSYTYSLYYLRILSISVPFMILMLAANACLRGAGDSVTPAIAMIVVDVVNIFFSFGLTRGWLGMPAMGFRGIAIGTVIAYVAGGVIQFAVLVSGRGKLRLFLHRLRPHWTTMRRVLRIGLPSGAEGALVWAAQFSIVIIINRLDKSNVMGAAHIITVRIESLSFMTGLAVATAAATVVGQSLGMRNPLRAARAAHLSYLIGGGAMSLCGLFFIIFRYKLAGFLSTDPAVVRLSAACLLITAFSQPTFAASLIYAGALRGAGDTFVVMVINLASVVCIRLVAAVIVTLGLGYGLRAVWVVLAIELSLRGLFVFGRFLHGGWKHTQV